MQEIKTKKQNYEALKAYIEEFKKTIEMEESKIEDKKEYLKGLLMALDFICEKDEQEKQCELEEHRSVKSLVDY